jgi:hypothetical protein
MIRMSRIFISYRREGGAGFSGRLADDLGRRFGANEVFRDIEDIASGEDFVARLDKALRDCRVLLVVIGKTWLTASANGQRRLDDPNDFVRLEISHALAAGVRVIPVLVEGARVPPERDLPDALKPLARRQAHELSESRWDYDVGRLARVVEQELAAKGAPSPLDSKSTRRRWMLVLALLGAAGMVAAGAAWFSQTRLPDLGGNWRLQDGSTWIIEQTGRELAIKVVHYESREVWQRGSGTIDGKELAFKLDLVYQAGNSLGGKLRISDDARRLDGVAQRTPSGTRVEILLERI